MLLSDQAAQQSIKQSIKNTRSVCGYVGVAGQEGRALLHVSTMRSMLDV